MAVEGKLRGISRFRRLRIITAIRGNVKLPGESDVRARNVLQSVYDQPHISLRCRRDRTAVVIVQYYA